MDSECRVWVVAGVLGGAALGAGAVLVLSGSEGDAIQVERKLDPAGIPTIELTGPATDGNYLVLRDKPGLPYCDHGLTVYIASRTKGTATLQIEGLKADEHLDVLGTTPLRRCEQIGTCAEIACLYQPSLTSLSPAEVQMAERRLSWACGVPPMPEPRIVDVCLDPQP